MRNHRPQDVLARSYELVRLQMAGKLKPLPGPFFPDDLSDVFGP